MCRIRHRNKSTIYTLSPRSNSPIKLDRSVPVSDRIRTFFAKPHGGYALHHEESHLGKDLTRWRWQAAAASVNWWLTRSAGKRAADRCTAHCTPTPKRGMIAITPPPLPSPRKVIRGSRASSCGTPEMRAIRADSPRRVGYVNVELHFRK